VAKLVMIHGWLNLFAAVVLSAWFVQAKPAEPPPDPPPAVKPVADTPASAAPPSVSILGPELPRADKQPTEPKKKELLVADEPGAWPTPTVPAFGKSRPDAVPALGQSRPDAEILRQPIKNTSSSVAPASHKEETATPELLPDLSGPPPLSPSTERTMPIMPAPARFGVLSRVREWLGSGPGVVFEGAAAVTDSDVPGPSTSLPEPTLPPPSPSPSEPLKLPEPAAPEAAALEPAPKHPSGWVSAEFLLWLSNRAKLITPLLTTGPAQTATPPGALGDPKTQTLLGSDFLRLGNYPGIRGSTGYWFTSDHLWGVELEGFWAGSTGLSQAVLPSSTSSGVLARPFVDARNLTTAVALISFPNVFTGSIQFTTNSEIYGAELNCTGKLLHHGLCDVNVLAGLRWLELAERLNMASNSFTLQDDVIAFNNALLPAGTTVFFFDHFATKDRFVGPQMGISGTCHLGSMFVDLAGKLAMGDTQQIIDIQGSTTRILPGGATATLPGGVYALNSNSGRFVHDVFSVVPEVQVTLGYQCLECLRVFFSYDFLFWSQTVRPGDQINPVLNPLRIPTNLPFNPTSLPAEPTVPFHARGFWIQGVSIGLEWKY
jgi:hypothetical protein